MKLAYADRDTYYGDPFFVDVPLRELLSDQYTNLRRPLIDLKKGSTERRPGDSYKIQPILRKMRAPATTQSKLQFRIRQLVWLLIAGEMWSLRPLAAT